MKICKNANADMHIKYIKLLKTAFKKLYINHEYSNNNVVKLLHKDVFVCFFKARHG